MPISDYLTIEKVGESTKVTFGCDTFYIDEATCVFTQDGGDDYSERSICGINNPNQKEAGFWFRVNDNTWEGRRRFNLLFNEIYNELAANNIDYVDSLMENSAIEYRLSHDVLFLWLNTDMCRTLAREHNVQMIGR